MMMTTRGWTSSPAGFMGLRWRPLASAAAGMPRCTSCWYRRWQSLPLRLTSWLSRRTGRVVHLQVRVRTPVHRSLMWAHIQCNSALVCLLCATEPQSLAPHLAEFVLEQFSREQTLRLSVLRIGTLVTIQSKPLREVRCYPHFLFSSAVSCVLSTPVSCGSVLTPA